MNTFNCNWVDTRWQ